ncbi:MAG: hypothetical protein ACOCP8_04405 [archaeon]
MKRLVKKASIELMHGTTDKFLDEIKEKGIQPPGKSGNMVTGPMAGGYLGVTQPNMVYLTNMEHIAEYYANRAAEAYGGNPIILIVNVDEKELEPDEDFYNNCIPRNGEYNLTIPTTGEEITLTDDEYDDFTGKDCLELMWTAGHWGTILPNKIVEIISD